LAGFGRGLRMNFRGVFSMALPGYRAAPIPRHPKHDGSCAQSRVEGRGGSRPPRGLQRRRHARSESTAVRCRRSLPQDGTCSGDLPRRQHPRGKALNILQVPAARRRRLRTTYGLERLNKEVKRRNAVAALCPNEASLLRLASAVLSEISDDWETERAYLTM